MLVFVRETYAPVLLQKKTERLRKETGNEQLTSKYDTHLSPRDFLLRSIVRPMKMLFRSPIVFFLSLYMAVVYGYLYLLFTTMTNVFQSIYHFHGGTVGLAYLGIGIGMFLGLFISGATSDRFVAKLTERNGGERKPEYRLPLMIPAALIIPIGLFMYGWSAQYAVHWIVPIIGTSFVGVGLITTFVSSTFPTSSGDSENTNRELDAGHHLLGRIVHHLFRFRNSCQYRSSIPRRCFATSSWTNNVQSSRPRLGELASRFHCSGDGAFANYLLEVWREDSYKQKI
jgi:hypothetical protein